MKCTLVLGEVAGDGLTGSIRYEDETGRLLATLSDVRALLVDLGAGSRLETAGSGQAPEPDEADWRIEQFPGVKELPATPR